MFLSNEEARIQLSEHIDAVMGSKIAFDIGTKQSRPIYQLISPEMSPGLELSIAVQINVDRARRSWSDFRAVIRILKIPFLIQAPSGAVGLMRRHPDYRALRSDQWIAEHNERSREVRNAHGHEERIAALERDVAELRNRAG